MYGSQEQRQRGETWRRLTRVGVLALLSCLTLSCAVFGIRREPQPAYAVLYQEGNKELRHYAGYLLATTWSAGAYDTASRSSFRRLFKYISGHNSGQQGIPMTAPVLQETGATIPMTAPVLQSQEQQGWSMSFVLPATYTMATVPRPLDDTITLREVPAAYVAVLRYSWGTSAETMARLGQELSDWIERQARYQVLSQPRSARYDPPWTLPFLRRNELHLEVRDTTTAREETIWKH